MCSSSLASQLQLLVSWPVQVGTTLYNPDLDDSTHMAAYYNCSALETPTYTVTREVEDGQVCRCMCNKLVICVLDAVGCSVLAWVASAAVPA